MLQFLGCTHVDQPKGIEVVKDAIKKLQFTQQLKKSETKDAAKSKKVEITISVDGVAIQVSFHTILPMLHKHFKSKRNYENT